MPHVRRSIAAAALLVVVGGPAGAGDDRPAPFVVHEWGTFTSVQGSDGVGLEGLEHEEEALPGFVYDRQKLRDCPLRTKGWKGLELPAHHVTQKLETPVLYFHTTTPRRVQVRVDFVGGLSSQWYPVVDTLGPPEGPCDATPLDVRTVPRSFVTWDVDLLPRTGPAPAEIPTVAPQDPWAFARDVDAAYVRTRPRQGPDRAGPVEAEHDLFYRGLGAFTLPFTATLDDAGRPTFANGSAETVAHVLALEIEEGGKRGRYDIECGVGPGAATKDPFAARPLEPWTPEGSPGLRADLTKLLVGKGLGVDEAKAMLATWSRSWFGAPGLRLLYVVPRPLVDARRPLRIDPAPDHLVRVLIGRIECLPSDRVAVMEQALRELARTSGGDAPHAARAGDGAAFERLYRRFVAVVHGIALARVGPSAADDVVQETFLALHRSLETVRDPAALPGWVCAVARRPARLRARGGACVRGGPSSPRRWRSWSRSARERRAPAHRGSARRTTPVTRCRAGRGSPRTRRSERSCSAASGG